MLHEGRIWVGTGKDPVFLLPGMANRHGLIAGATGTGKTVSLKVLAEGFSDMGVPVFLSDVKSDLSGMVLPGTHSAALEKRLNDCGVVNFEYDNFPTVFWDVYGEQGHPVRATVQEMGALLLSRMLDLNDTQTGVLNIVYRVASDMDMPLITIRDLKAMLAYVGEHAKDFTIEYGNVSMSSVGAIQRAVAMLEDQGGNVFFGEPSIDLDDWLRTDERGRGNINILAADKLFENPTMYSTFLLWMLTELYSRLPEQGDSDKPKVVFFFDEAHLLFKNCSKSLMEKIEQVVRLIRSKGVGVYFITQSPDDIPMSILGQLGNRVQHALRAYTPLDQKAVKVAAQTFRVNPDFDTEEAITTLRTGEALVSFLDQNGAPCIVDKVTVLPPQSYMGAIDPATRQQVIDSSPLKGCYDESIERDGAYVMLQPGYVRPSDIPTTPPQVQVSTAQHFMSQMFMVYDPTTGQYVQKELNTMSQIPQQDASIQQQPVTQPMYQQPMYQQPVAQPAVQPVYQQPVAQPAAQPVYQQSIAQPVYQQPVQQVPTIQVQPQLQQMPVMVLDPTTGQYVQQMMTMQLDPATGNYVAVQPQQTVVTDPRELERQQKEAAKAAKAAEDAARRARSDELREERAERARKNDSVLGRVKNTAISTASREVTRSIIKGLGNGLKGIFGGKK